VVVVVVVVVMVAVLVVAAVIFGLTRIEQGQGGLVWFVLRQRRNAWVDGAGLSHATCLQREKGNKTLDYQNLTYLATPQAWES